MGKMTTSYRENLDILEKTLRVSESFDIVKRTLKVGETDMTFFFVDGFVKDSEMQRVMSHMLSQRTFGTAEEVMLGLPYVEVELARDFESIAFAVLSGQAVILSEPFSDSAILIDARTYPVRGMEEPDGDRVMLGSHDGFVETLVMNTALIRRRIRDTRLTMQHHSVGGVSKTDVVLCYMSGVANERDVREIARKLRAARPASLTLGFQSLAECLIGKGWYNPFPKIRTTERPDTAAAQLIEGSILLICDNSPQVIILPTSVFQYLEEANDYYFPPLTGSYLRIVRTAIMLISVFVTPLWYLCLEYAERLPSALAFLVPENTGALPVILQLFLVEIAIDGLKIASMNTPDMLSNSLSVVGALLLGDFAVEVGWLCADVILYMAFVSIANFAQQNYELGYALKFVRMLTLLLVFLLGIWGLLLGAAIFVLLVATNNTLLGRRYLYPLIPFDRRAFSRLIFRHKRGEYD